MANQFTQRFKRNITSSEQQLLKSCASKLIIFGHRYPIALIIKHIRKNNGLQGETCSENHKSFV